MIRNRKFILPVGALLAVIALATVVMMVRANADELLQQSARLLADANAGHAVLDFELSTPEKSGSGTIEVWGREEAGPDGEPAFRIELKDASGEDSEHVGSLVISNGREVWLWRPAKNTVYVGTVEELKARMHEGHDEELTGYDLPDYSAEDMPQTPEEAVDRLLQRFDAERVGSVALNSMRANQVRLVPIPEEMPDEIRAVGGLFDVWVRAGDSAPLGLEFSGSAAGTGKVTASLLELEIPDDASSQLDFDQDLFTFAIPEGAEVKQLADLEPPALSLDEAANLANFDVLVPASLPAGASLEAINEVRGAIVQRYSLPDGASFTVAQGEAGAGDAPDGADGAAITVRGMPGMLYQNEDGTRSLLTWQQEGIFFWIGGDINGDEAIGIADSLN